MSGACEQRDIDLHDLHESSVEPGGEPARSVGAAVDLACFTQGSFDSRAVGRTCRRLDLERVVGMTEA